MAKKQIQHISAFRTVLISSLVSVADVVVSFVLAAITGSSVMFAQGLQGLADLTTTLFLLLGVTRADREASKTHPLGYGRELFFWVLISSLLAFLFNGGLASFRALQQLIDGSPVDSVELALIALGFGAFTNGYALRNSLLRLKQKASGRSLFSYIRDSSLVETKMTLLVDFMGTLSAVLGLVALAAYSLTGNPVFDGLGALVIGALTAAGALFVIVDLHDLIVGRRPSLDVITRIKKAALAPEGVIEILDLRATAIGSGKILALLEVHFEDKTTAEIEQITDQIKDSVMKAVPEVSHVQVEAETPVNS